MCEGQLIGHLHPVAIFHLAVQFHLPDTLRFIDFPDPGPPVAEQGFGGGFDDFGGGFDVPMIEPDFGFDDFGW